MLSNPVMEHVLYILENEAKPRGTPEPRPNAHLDTLTTQRYCKLQGIQHAVDLLWKLTEPVAPNEEQRPPSDPAEQLDFFHALPSEIQDAIRKNWNKVTPAQ